MSRVTRSTFRSTAAAALVVASFGLASCGGDDDPKATTGATGTTPVTKAQEPFPGVLKSEVAVTKEGMTAISSASTKKVSAGKVKSQAKDLLSQLKKAGLDAESTAASSGGPSVIQLGSTTVMVYPSEQLAATQAASFVRVIDTAKTDGRIARYGRVVVATSAPDGMTKKLKSEFETVRNIAAKADL
jgi:hypothetical protein